MKRKDRMRMSERERMSNWYSSFSPPNCCIVIVRVMHSTWSQQGTESNLWATHQIWSTVILCCDTWVFSNPGFLDSIWFTDQIYSYHLSVSWGDITMCTFYLWWTKCNHCVVIQLFVVFIGWINIINKIAFKQYYCGHTHKHRRLLVYAT